MPTKKMCPDCEVEMEEIKFTVAAGPSKNGKYPSEEQRVKYYCHECKKEFLEDDLN